MARKKIAFIVLLTIFIVCIQTQLSFSQNIPIPKISFEIGQAKNPSQVSSALEVLFLLTLLSLAPAILIMTTSFTRIVIVLSFLRQALGVQTIPPNQVVVGLSLFLTFFIMLPVGQKINDNALTPYLNGKIEQRVALKNAIAPLREFMLKQTREKDLALFIHLSKSKRPANPDEVETLVLIPAFIISELKTAFTMGFVIYLPFLVVDMIVASTLMSMGMLMLPPVMISLPFKLLLFVMIDGWNLLISALITSFR